MKLRKITRRFLLETAGLDFEKAVAIQNTPLWTPVMVVASAADADRSYLAKSIRSSVDENGKRSSFMMMVDSLFQAIALEDFSSFFANSVVTYKTAHTFKYKDNNHSVKELKRGKKDRIYIYPYTGVCGKFVFIFEAVHKNQMPTPDEVKQYAEKMIKEILDAKLMVLC